MSQLLARLRSLGQKAEQVRLALDAAPARAAQIREAVQTTAGRLQELRGEVEGTLTDLKTGSDVSVASKLAELDGAGPLFARAGFRLTGIDVEQGAAPRVLVHFEQTNSPVASPESLIAECGDRRTVLALLAALERARNLSDAVSLRSFEMRGVTVQLGAVPSVRLLWRPEVGSSHPVPPPIPQPDGPAKPVASVAVPGFQAYGSGSFFERRSPAASEASSSLPIASREITASPAPEATPPVVPVTSVDWRKDALARFKKMPDLRR
jgi:hypothetical protein